MHELVRFQVNLLVGVGLISGHDLPSMGQGGCQEWVQVCGDRSSYDWVGDILDEQTGGILYACYFR